MFRINYVNITLWILGGLLFLFLLFLIIKKFLKKNNDKTSNISSNKNNIYINSEIKNIFHHLSSIYEYDMAANVLFKNRFSKSKYSAIPILVSKEDGSTFLIANPIKNLKSQNYKIVDNNILKVTKKREEYVYNNSRYKEIIKFLSSINCSIKIIIPYIGTKPVSLDNLVGVEEIGEFINNYVYENNNDIKNIYKKLKSINIYKNKRLEVN